MIRTEKGCGQIFKIYGVSETEVKDALQEILNQGSAVPVCTRRRGKEVHVLAETAETDEERAKELLRSPNSKIYVVAQEVGYTNKSHFCYQFKKQTGMTPSKFKDTSAL